MHTQPQRSSITFPHGFLDFLKLSPGRRHRVGEYELQPDRLSTFNLALHALCPEAPAMTLDQIVTAAERARSRHADGSTPPFVASRMRALQRLEAMAVDPGWNASAELRRQVAVLQAYRADGNDLIPDSQPVIGLLDDAVLVDVALQLLQGELADYEDFCQFRRVAAEFADVPEDSTDLTREHWLEAMAQARISRARIDGATDHYVPDPRVSLFHIG